MPAFEANPRAAPRQGATLYNNYGAWKPNAQLVLGYGFALPGNPRDEFHVSIGVATGAKGPGQVGGSGGPGWQLGWQLAAGTLVWPIALHGCGAGEQGRGADRVVARNCRAGPLRSRALVARRRQMMRMMRRRARTARRMGRRTRRSCASSRRRRSSGRWCCGTGACPQSTT